MTRVNYLKALLKYNASFIRASYQQPNEYMSQSNLLCHVIAYRRLTGVDLRTLSN